MAKSKTTHQKEQEIICSIEEFAKDFRLDKKATKDLIATSTRIFMELLKEIFKLRLEKTRDYGGSMFYVQKKFGKHALYFDMLRKFARLESLLLGNKKPVGNESLEDTFIDLAVISLNNVVFFRMKKEYPEIFAKI